MGTAIYSKYTRKDGLTNEVIELTANDTTYFMARLHSPECNRWSIGWKFREDKDRKYANLMQDAMEAGEWADVTAPIEFETTDEDDTNLRYSIVPKTITEKFALDKMGRVS